MTAGWRAAATAALATAFAMIATVLLLQALGPDWSVFAPATCTATHCFCEAPRVGALFLQPSDSWSAFGYVFAGLLMIVLARRGDWNSALTPFAAQMFGLTAITVGLGSVIMHATLTLWGQFLDVLGMYLVGSFMLVRAVARWRAIPDRTAMILYVALCAALVTVLIVAPEVRRFLFAGLLISAIVVELAFARPLRPGAQVRFYLLGIVAKAVAFAIWNLDQNLLLCAPDSLWQGHSAWHLLGATSLWLTFLYYRSERDSARVGD
ncbi:MAG: ceramidase domain-containing protein [Pseudomonadota bacterium]